MPSSFVGRSKRVVLGLAVMSIAGLLLFQNCGKAGFDEMDDGLGSATQSSLGDQRLANAPFPFVANLNEIAYMSCPAPGTSKRKDALDSLNPYFNVRAGAFDNLQYSQIFRTSSLTSSEQSYRLQAGLGVSQEFINYIKTKYARDDKEIIYQSIMGYPATQGAKLTMALINEDRSRVEGGFGWDYRSFAQMGDVVSGTVMANYLGNAPLVGNYGTQKLGFFSALDSSQRGIVASMSWGNNELDRETFNSQLKTNLDLVLGYGPSGMSDITQLISPDSDSYKTVYGRGYRLTFGTSSIDGLVALKSHFLKGVEELNMSVKPVTNISSSESQAWDCFSLRIVRHVDRMDPATGHPYRNPGIYDFVNSSGTVVRGVRVACPVQQIGSETTPGTLNYKESWKGVTAQKNMLRLQMARRVLPADFWEVNTDPNFMCAVPTDLAMAKGSCYSSGDSDSSKYIQYSLNQTLANGTTAACGTSGNECPAFVSICYRSY